MTTVGINTLVAAIRADYIGGKMTHSNQRTEGPSWRGDVVSCELKDEESSVMVAQITNVEIWTPKRWEPHTEKNGTLEIDLAGWSLSLDECPHCVNWDTGELLEFHEEVWSPIVRIERIE